jgi:hypothetical protein
MPRLRMRGAIPPFPQYVFIAWCLVKHRDNFTFTLLIFNSKIKKAKGNFPVLLLTEHHAMKAYWRSGGVAPRIL